MTTFTTQDRQDAQRVKFKCTCGYSIGHPLVPKCTCTKVQPLHEDLIYGYAYKHGVERGDVLEFARAIERAHGIGE